jgi:nucleotide-binding universal stress UspA family protein
VLVVRGPPAISRVLVAIGAEHDARAIGGAAIDLARQLAVPLHLLAVLPAFVSPDAENAVDPSRDLLAYARLHGVEPIRVIDRGNPIERIRHHVAPDDLLVLGHSRPRRNSVFSPDVSTWLLHHAACSTLFVPWTRQERAA